MASEISISGSISATKGGATVSSGGQAKTIDMAGDQMIGNVQVVGFSAGEAILLGDVTAASAYLFIRNMDTVNFVELAIDEPMVSKFAKLLAGEFAIFRASAAIYAKADTGACNVQVVAVEL